ncbi:SusC/RagA family TonB-linked outer membrane protein [Pseudochryseolinea flava]|uniref:SusC/RagA family protein n=1 Tax=Pseudochryseolinea flava TaxID=2059302 RepID=A0A364XZT0_9BACT|nr:TonB-dependent receptor [Pseudochryseolinea flava]RAW00042.1 SusC/RagA family protein [Pseudochryseolinea flava]
MNRNLLQFSPPKMLQSIKGMLLLIMLSLTLVRTVAAQDLTITGQVKGADDGAALPGVTIIVKGSTNGTSSDADGRYTIKVSDPNAILVFSFIGYAQQEVALANRTTVDVSLEADIAELSEVVIIGYGEVKKSNVIGSVSSVKAEDLTRIPAGNVMESLQGSVPGMDITRTSGAAGANVNIAIRGNRSLTASGSPLFIVDGIQYNSIQDINPNDIQSMEVLKDAASTAIYGSRGANGVILVTTKRGSGKTKVSFNTYTGVSSLNGYPDVQNGAQYAAQRREANRTAGKWSSEADDGTIFSVAELDNIKNNRSTDWRDLMLHNGSIQDYQVGLTSSSDKTSFYASLNYFREKGLFENDVLQRYTFRTNIDHKISEKFKVGTQNQFSYYDIDRRRDPLNISNKLSPLEDAYDSTGAVIPWLNNNKTVNPLMDEEGDNFVNNSVVTRLFSSLYVEFKPIKDLTFKSIIGVTSSNTRDGIFASAMTVARNGIKPFTSFTNTTDLSINMENILTYNKEINGHTFTITGVQSLLRNKREVHASSGINQLISAQGYYGLGNANEQIITGAPYTESGLLSFTGRVQYDYKEKYLLTLIGRSDGASQLSPGLKWNFFPSVQAGWRIIEEAFMAGATTVSDLKLRASYGLSGNYAVDPYSTQSNLARVPMAYDEKLAVGYMFDTKLGNDDLSWEKSTTVNVGIDFGFLSNRLTGSIDLFRTKTVDLLLNRFLPASSGATRIVQNIGETDNRGIEIALSAVPVQTDKFTWKIGATWFKTREEIVALATESDDIANGWFIGQPTRVFYDYEKIGIWQTADADLATTFGQVPGEIRVKDQDNSGGIDATKDRVIIGSALPQWIGSFNSDFKIGNFDVSIQMFARWGQTIQYDFANIYDPTANENSIEHDYWTPENPSNDYPRPNANTSRSAMRYLSTLLYRDGSFMKLRGITIGYNLPSTVLSKTPFSRVRIYLNGKNLFTHSKIDNYDPEGGGNESNPLSRLIVGGINLEF